MYIYICHIDTYAIQNINMISHRCTVIPCRWFAIFVEVISHHQPLYRRPHPDVTVDMILELHPNR